MYLELYLKLFANLLSASSLYCYLLYISIVVYGCLHSLPCCTLYAFANFFYMHGGLLYSKNFEYMCDNTLNCISNINCVRLFDVVHVI